MVLGLLIAVIILLLGVLALQIGQRNRRIEVDLSAITQMLAAVEKSYERTERTVRDEIGKNREESTSIARQGREEIGATLRNLGDALNGQLSTLIQSNERKLDQLRHDAVVSAKVSRDENLVSLKNMAEILINNVVEVGKLQKGQLDVFSERLDKLTQSNEQKLEAMRKTIEQHLATLQEDNGRRIDQMRQETATGVQKVREEVAAALALFGDSLVKSLETLGGSQRTQLGHVTDQLTKLTDSNERKLDAARTSMDERLKLIQDDSGKKLDHMRVESTNSGKQMREEIGLSLKSFSELLNAQVGKLTESSERRMDALKLAVEEKLKSLQEDNGRSLEQMRQTVDEKLQGTLEKRLGESFKLVSERLEQVYKGLGEMQHLATGVGDLKRVLTNVKSRGTWGEVQLGALLEQVLSPEQYDMNVVVKDGSERVEFAIKMPNRGEDGNEVLYLPIDAKFPVEDYQRLSEALERADPDAAEIAAKQLEVRIKQCAKDICAKYINPPKTTDFAILFLPTEGLFAEVLRRNGLPEVIQRECRVVIAGPTTLWSILNSLQMGFRTLAIQKRSSEVWTVLAAVKTEFSKYGDVLAKVQKKLLEASDTIDKDVAVRARAIQRRLRAVEEVPLQDEQTLMLDSESDSETDNDKD